MIIIFIHSDQARMAPSSSTEFIDTALFCNNQFALSYVDPDQKFLLRKHIVSLLQDLPSLEPSYDTFTHNNGETVKLLNVNGELRVSQSTPLVPLTIWLHQNYPIKAPIVIISPTKTHPIRNGHPFVNPSGITSCTYLETWSHNCNLTNLVRNLVKIFARDHPFVYITTSSFTIPSLVSKREALDRLMGSLHYDLIAQEAMTHEEIEKLTVVQIEMVKRVDITTSILIELNNERKNLKKMATKFEEEADGLRNWLLFNDSKSTVAMVSDDDSDVFDGEDDESRTVLDCLAADKAIGDVIDALDEAIMKGVVSFDEYLKQVRRLAREQFFHRAMVVKLKGDGILHLLN